MKISLRHIFWYQLLGQAITCTKLCMQYLGRSQCGCREVPDYNYLDRLPVTSSTSGCSGDPSEYALASLMNIYPAQMIQYVSMNNNLSCCSIQDFLTTQTSLTTSITIRSNRLAQIFWKTYLAKVPAHHWHHRRPHHWCTWTCKNKLKAKTAIYFILVENKT